MCSEMHNIKGAIYENKRKLEGIAEDYQIQVSISIFSRIETDLKEKEMCFPPVWFMQHISVHVSVDREAAPRHISCKEHCKALSVISTWSCLMLTFMTRYCYVYHHQRVRKFILLCLFKGLFPCFSTSHFLGIFSLTHFAFVIDPFWCICFVFACLCSVVS